MFTPFFLHSKISKSNFVKGSFSLATEYVIFIFYLWKNMLVLQTHLLVYSSGEGVCVVQLSHGETGTSTCSTSFWRTMLINVILFKNGTTSYIKCLSCHCFTWHYLKNTYTHTHSLSIYLLKPRGFYHLSFSTVDHVPRCWIITNILNWKYILHRFLF